MRFPFGGDSASEAPFHDQPGGLVNFHFKGENRQ